MKIRKNFIIKAAVPMIPQLKSNIQLITTKQLKKCCRIEAGYIILKVA